MLSTIDLIRTDLQVFIDGLNTAISNNDPAEVIENLRNIGIKVTYNSFILINPDLGKTDVLKDAIRHVIDDAILATHKASYFREAIFLKDFREILSNTKDGLRRFVLSSQEEEFFAKITAELDIIAPEYVNGNKNKRPRPL